MKLVLQDETIRDQVPSRYCDTQELKSTMIKFKKKFDPSQRHEKIIIKESFWRSTVILH